MGGWSKDPMAEFRAAAETLVKLAQDIEAHEVKQMIERAQATAVAQRAARNACMRTRKTSK